MYKLVTDTIDNNDIDHLCDWLKTYPRLTKGNETTEFEDKFSQQIGVKYSVFVNSGSSAILLGLYSLLSRNILIPGDHVVVPALSWATDFAPIVQLGLNPIIVDCNMDDLSLDLEQLEHVCKYFSPKAVLLVSVLGLSPNMEKILRLKQKYEFVLLEDTCESLGSSFISKQLGSFGDISFFSMFFGHHISTIEGGMVCTDDFDTYENLKMLRSHGWTRDVSPKTQKRLKNRHKISTFNNNYTFYVPGFNLRSTDLQAFLGRHQLYKLPDIITKRQENYYTYWNNLYYKIWKPKCNYRGIVSNFAYPIIHHKRTKILKALDGICETRPLIAGSMTKQPMCQGYKSLDTPNADKIHTQGLYLPNHAGLNKNDILDICDIINGVI